MIIWMSFVHRLSSKYHAGKMWSTGGCNRIGELGSDIYFIKRPGGRLGKYAPGSKSHSSRPELIGRPSHSSSGSLPRLAFRLFFRTPLMFAISHNPFLKSHLCKRLQRDVQFGAHRNKVMKKSLTVIDIAPIHGRFTGILRGLTTLANLPPC